MSWKQVLEKKKKVFFICLCGDSYVTGDKIDLRYFNNIMCVLVEPSRPGSNMLVMFNP